MDGSIVAAEVNLASVKVWIGGDQPPAEAVRGPPPFLVSRTERARHTYLTHVWRRGDRHERDISNQDIRWRGDTSERGRLGEMSQAGAQPAFPVSWLASSRGPRRP